MIGYHIVFDPDQESYSQFILGHARGSFLQSWGWGAWQERLGKKIARFAIVDEDNTWVGAGTAVVMTVPIFKFCYLYIPYGPVVDQTCSVRAIHSLIDALVKKFPESICVRIEATYETGLARAKKTLNIQPASSIIMDLTKSNEELLAGMHHKTRYNINLAKKHGVVVTVDDTLNIDALRLIAETAKRQGYMTYPTDYYQKLLDFFSSGDVTASLYMASYQGRVLATGLMIDFGNTRTYLFGGSSDVNRNVMAPYVLHFQAMMDAKEKHITSYDFWGAETAAGHEAGFVRFKKGFGGDIIIYPGAVDWIIKLWHYRLYTAARALGRLGLVNK